MLALYQNGSMHHQVVKIPMASPPTTMPNTRGIGKLVIFDQF